MSRNPTALAQLKIRMRESLRTKLEAAAEQCGHSLNSEAVRRLERSFDREEMHQNVLSEALMLAYGELAGLLILMGAAMDHAGQEGRFATLDDTDSNWTPWSENPFAYDQAVRAANRILEVMRPEGEIDAPHENLTRLGEYCADAKLIDVAGPQRVTRSDQTPSGVEVSTLLSRKQLGRAKTVLKNLASGKK